MHVAMTKIYGIPNCDTMKKARAWLGGHGITYVFHDYRKDGLDKETLDRWADRAGWEKLLNRAGTTFRKLPEAERSSIDRNKAIRLMLEYPAMIKRPIAETDDLLLVGFDPARYEEVFGPV